jgi:predicted aspartyl protease
MGETYVKVSVRRAPEAESWEELNLIVDTGATYSWMPRSVLEKLRVQPIRKASFRTIKGDVVTRNIGYVFVEYEGELGPTTVVFAESGDAAVFGLHALETLGLEVDPTTRQVRKSESLLAL